MNMLAGESCEESGIGRPNYGEHLHGDSHVDGYGHVEHCHRLHHQARQDTGPGFDWVGLTCAWKPSPK